MQQRNSLLRKTQSQPTKSKTSTLPKTSKDKKTKEAKHVRTKSIPTSSENATNVKSKDSSADSGSGKPPGSPTVKDADKSSPKPKRSIFGGFKHTLRSKKSHDSSKSSSHLGSNVGGSNASSQISSSHLSPGGSASYANVHSAMDSTPTGSEVSPDSSVKVKGGKQHSTDSSHSEEVS